MALPLGNWLRLTLLGGMLADTWSTSYWFSISAYAVPSVTALDAVAASALTDFDSKVWSAATGPLKANNASYCTLTGLRALAYTNNDLDQSATHAITPIAGTGTSNHPPYVAQVATLLTARAGRRNRGRSYLPATGLGVSATTGQQSGSPASLANNLAAWLSNSPTWITGGLSWSDLVPVVMTQMGGSPQTVTSVRIDSKFDTQRGRENKIIPTVTASAAVT